VVSHGGDSEEQTDDHGCRSGHDRLGGGHPFRFGSGHTPEGEIVRTDLAKGTTQTPLAIVTQGQATTFYVQNVLLKPAASSGWHTHPGPEYSVVTKGTVYVQMANGCPATAFNEGQAIFIPGGVPHVVYNQGPDEANGVVTYTLPVDLPIREDVPDACP
jgi:quercetin dioxygenase-like cupin family protein